MTSVSGTTALGSMENASKVSEKTEPKDLSLFLKTLKEVTLSSINGNNKLLSVNELNVKGVCDFVMDLCEDGYAKMVGTDQECRSICVTAQGAIEDALTQMLMSGEITSVKAFFLTPLPTTPLRKEGATQGLTKGFFEEARQYTLDKRENTVRELRDAGAVIMVAYSQESYEELKSKVDDGSTKQVSIWEKECKHDNVINMPLNIKVPKDLIGALYLIRDNNDNVFFLPTQGIQAADASEGKAVWKKWLSLSTAKDDEGVMRSREMMDCIMHNCNADVGAEASRHLSQAD